MPSCTRPPPTNMNTAPCASPVKCQLHPGVWSGVAGERNFASSGQLPCAAWFRPRRQVSPGVIHGLGGAAAAATTGRRFRLGKSIHLHSFPRLLSTAVLLLSGRGSGRIVLQDCDGSPDA